MTADETKTSQGTVGDQVDLDAATVASVHDQDDGGGQERVLAAGSYVGRYLVLEQLGRGGMGVVYKAYDPELDRRIALKLLRVQRRSQSKATRARDRLMREAKALAQLSHPNVVSAYDVGTHEQDVFVAMELVEGKTFKQWLAEAKPGPRQILQVMVDAGRGIAAAHRAGLVHRDIKSDNIVIGDDARVRVLDFGLARAASLGELRADSSRTPSPEDQAPAEASMAGSILTTPMTLAGAVMGTPGYMAPEQYLGLEVDEQSDQYGFCVTLYEALVGRRPHQAMTYRELKTKVTTETVSMPATAKVPAWLRRILLRGLSLAKEDRYPSMADLLHQLSRDPRLVWRRASLMVLVLLLLGTSLAAVWGWQAKKSQICRSGAERLVGVWDPSVHDAVQAAFTGTGRAYAGDTFQRVAKILSQRADDWVAMRTEACEATHLRGEQSERLLDLRMTCLDRRLGQMRALTRLFAERADDKVVEKAIPAAFGLSDLAGCADTEALTAAVAPPSDPAVRKKLAGLRARLDEARALQKAGKFAAGRDLAVAVLAEADRIDYAPLTAEACYRLGTLQSETGENQQAEENLYRALDSAELARDDHLRAQAASNLIHVLGYRQARYQAALAISPLARSAARRVGAAPRLMASINNNEGLALWYQGKYQQARVLFERSLVLFEGELGAGHPEVAKTLNNIGLVLVRQGKFDVAEGIFQRALAIWELTLGDAHPMLAKTLNNLGLTLNKQGKPGALELYQRAIAIWEGAFGPRHPDLALSLNNIGLLLKGQGKHDEATGYFERAIDIWQESLGPDHPNVAIALNNLGEILSSQKQYAQARTQFERALVIFEKKLGPDHPNVSYVLTGLGDTLLGLGDTQAALPLLKRALSQRETTTGDKVELARTRFTLARALSQAGQHPRARTLARQARQEYLAAGSHTQSQVARIDTWLKRK